MKLYFIRAWTWERPDNQEPVYLSWNKEAGWHWTRFRQDAHPFAYKKTAFLILKDLKRGMLVDFLNYYHSHAVISIKNRQVLSFLIYRKII